MMKTVSFMLQFCDPVRHDDFTDGKTSRMPGERTVHGGGDGPGLSRLKALRKIARDYSGTIRDGIWGTVLNAVERWACSCEDNTRDREPGGCPAPQDDRRGKRGEGQWTPARADELEKIMNGRD